MHGESVRYVAAYLSTTSYDTNQVADASGAGAVRSRESAQWLASNDPLVAWRALASPWKRLAQNVEHCYRKRPCGDDHDGSGMCVLIASCEVNRAPQCAGAPMSQQGGT